MALADLLPLLTNEATYTQTAALLAAGRTVTLSDLPAAAKPFVLAGLVTRLRRPLLVVSSRADHAADLTGALSRYAPPGVTVDLWPAPDAIPYERLPRDEARTAARLNIMVEWLGLPPATTSPAPPTIPAPHRILVTPARGLMQLLMSPAQLRAATPLLQVGQSINLVGLINQWVAAGYESTSVVERPGSFSRRGGILDIWPPTSDQPIRVELWDDLIESLRRFDPTTQRSTGKIERIAVPPPVEVPLWEMTAARPAIEVEADLRPLRPEAVDEWQMMLERLSRSNLAPEVDLLAPYLLATPATLLDYLPAETLIVIDEPDGINLSGSQVEMQAEELRHQFEAQGELPAGLRPPFQPWSTTWIDLAARAGLRLEAAPADDLIPLPTGAPTLVDDRSQAVARPSSPVDNRSPAVAGSASPDDNRSPVSAGAPGGVDTGQPRSAIATRSQPITLRDFQPAPVFAGQTDRLAEAVADWLSRPMRVVLVSEQSQRLSELLGERDIFTISRKGEATPSADGHFDPERLRPPQCGTVEVIHGSLAGGWSHPGLQTVLLSDLELFGWQQQRRASGRRSTAAARAFLERLRPGDYVVHIEHGIAVYQGLITREAAGVEREYLLLQYAGADRLFVPVDQTDRVIAWSGPPGAAPNLNRLGSADWERAKRRVKKAVEDLAQELLAIYSTREVVPGHAYAPDGQWQIEMEEAFPYQETPDQQRAIDEVKRDMETDRPMDRLICGDVGYGKTEVALRAAFKAINDGRQVTVLVPTTVLALQHFETFSRRLSAFPVHVEMLSRLRTKRQQEATVKGLADGSIDLVIGTHRLLQRDVRPKNLGLVIIDEEQRFGVRHKERLKQLRTEVDVLAMSATPIPRTLHMSLVGVRDMSLIETPPEARLPIRTFVRPKSDNLVREVVLRELDRGGQIFFVHNRVQSIAHVAQTLRELVPEARFIIGHGQMEEDSLERVMLAFVRQEADVLICTTIIESGLDIPNVNTLIIDDAVNFGLAQLYQLRGRVGRSSNRAYAYLLYDPARPMTPEAQERLETIQEATELGAGFRIAMKDLELRGAGNLLGAAQHGHMEAVGFDLYTRMLAQAVDIARGNPPPKELPPLSLDLPLDAHLPSDYVADPDIRLGLYQRLAQPAEERIIAELERELIDRFGPLPRPAENLLAVVRVKNKALELGIESIGTIENELVIRPVPTSRLDAVAIRRIGRGAVRTTPSTVRLDLARLGSDWLAALNEALGLVAAAKEAATDLAL